MSTGSHGNSRKFEVTKLLVVFGKLALTLEDGDADLGLVVGSSGEYLTLFGRNRRVSVNQPGEDTSNCFDTEG